MTENEALKILKTISKYTKICEDDVYFDSTFVKAYEVAIKALEKQISKKPLHQGYVYACPCCNDKVTIGSVFLRPNQKYCTNCGQKLG